MTQSRPVKPLIEVEAPIIPVDMSTLGVTQLLQLKNQLEQVCLL